MLRQSQSRLAACIVRDVFSSTRSCVRQNHAVQQFHSFLRSLCATLSLDIGGIISISHDDLSKPVATYSCAAGQTLGGEVFT